MSLFTYHVACKLNVNPLWVTGVSSTLELTLPCINCRRDYRTVIFEKPHKEGICTPQAKCSGFRGKVVSRMVHQLHTMLEVSYDVEFDYEPFTDKELGKETTLGKYGWARIYFSILCPDCKQEAIYNTQENAVRPHKYACTCGKILYIEEKSPFTYSVAEKHNA